METENDPKGIIVRTRTTVGTPIPISWEESLRACDEALANGADPESVAAFRRKLELGMLKEMAG